MRCLLLILFAILLLGCSDDLPPGAERIYLTEDISSVGATAYQVYYSLEDTAGWERIVDAADSIYREPGYLKLRSDRIWYEMAIDFGEMKAWSPYPGWGRRIDSIPITSNVVYDSRWERMVADVPAADVVLGGDSVRVAVINIKDRAFRWQRFPLDYPDYLMLLPPGRDSMPISLTQDNVGPISSQTIFRVGRRYYGLRSLSDDRREMVIEALPKPGDVEVTAELDLNFRRTSVYDTTGQATYIERAEGKELILFFTALFPVNERIMGRLDSFYRAMPPEWRQRFQVGVILQNAPIPPTLPEYFARLSPDIAVYLGNEKTCLRLNCRPNYPYFVRTDARGRIRTFWSPPDDLADLFDP